MTDRRTSDEQEALARTLGLSLERLTLWQRAKKAGPSFWIAIGFAAIAAISVAVVVVDYHNSRTLEVTDWQAGMLDSRLNSATHIINIPRTDLEKEFNGLFNVHSYRRLPRWRYEEALTWLHDMMDY